MLLKLFAEGWDHSATDEIGRIDRNVHYWPARQKMKTTAIVISLSCFSLGLLAGEEPSPSPTPIFRHYAPRSGPMRRLNYFERKHESEARAEAAQAKAQAQANRNSAAAARAQAKAADRTRAQAQRQVAAEARIETRNQVPRANSDLMSRMGFSEEEIATEKAREQSAKSGTKETAGATSQAHRQQEQSTPTSSAGAGSDHPSVAPAKADGVPLQKQTGISPAAGPDSH